MMKYVVSTLLICIAIISSNKLIAQTGFIEGVVLDSVNSETLIGVNIITEKVMEQAQITPVNF